jgi:PIN domain nuclease of toxin-antitoxin system
MRYLLDTHVFLWMAAAPDQLSTRIRELVRQKSNRLHLSAASGWEIALLQNLGCIKLPDVPRRFIPEAIQHLQIVPLPIGFSTAIAAAMTKRRMIVIIKGV